jgi:hypothetical protein
MLLDHIHAGTVVNPNSILYCGNNLWALKPERTPYSARMFRCYWLLGGLAAGEGRAPCPATQTLRYTQKCIRPEVLRPPRTHLGLQCYLRRQGKDLQHV